MTGCAAIGCSNSSEKGFLMKRFPKDTKRRREWAVKTKRDKWFPTDSSVLCEAHFEPEMWEVTRQDGTKRLKSNAVPTIFKVTKLKSTRKCRMAIPSTSSDTMDTVFFTMEPYDISEISITSHDNVECEFVAGDVNVSKMEPYISIEIIEKEHSYASLSTLSNKTASSESVLKASTFSGGTSSSEDPSAVLEKLTKKEQLKLYENLLKKKKLLMHKYKNKLKAANRKLKFLEKKLQNNEKANILHKIFRNDQITALKKKTSNTSTKLIKWSDETIRKALQLKFQCGSSGYAEILKQNLPFPSERTLQRRLRNLKFDSGKLDGLPFS